MVKDTQLIDQQGISFISGKLAKIECSFNEHAREIGIDGIIEIRDVAYHSTGKLIACQVKSGESYFENEDKNNYYLYIDKMHIDYWLRCNLPVLFFIYSPEQEEAYWTQVVNFNLSEKDQSFLIEIPKKQKLSNTSKENFYSVCFGKLYSNDIEFQQVLNDLRDIKYTASVAPISAYEMFINGLTDNCKQLFFSTYVYSEIMESKIVDAEFCGFSWPSSMDMFFERYLETLRFHCLIQGDFSFEIEMLNSGLLPIFLKPLSLNGLRFIKYFEKNNVKIYPRCCIESQISYDVFDEFKH